MGMNEIRGSEFTYKIDTSYGLSQDGYIATGTESIVYKGLKISKDKKFVLSCVLKFKYKRINDTDIVKRFKESELKIFDALQNCRSVVRIYDVIEDLGDFTVVDKHIPQGRKPLLIDREKFFCVVEEFVDGWSLEEYCRDEFWKLTETRDLQYGIKERVGFHNFAESVKKQILNSYKHDYNSILKYQNEMYKFMINFCEIMEYITESKNVLHLDIKPDNIMVTRYGKELILIDFGRAAYLNQDGYVESNLLEADYNTEERIDRMFQYGTLGYAAPENYVKPIMGSQFPLASNEITFGKMTIESDIFSFGATFWECLNMFELYTGNKEFAKAKGEGGSYDFYKNYVLNDLAYCDRDLSLTSRHYHYQLEKIIEKCTRRRRAGYDDKNNKMYYHSYKELREDIEKARDSSPAIVKTDNVKIRNTFGIMGVALGIVVVLFLIRGILGLSVNVLAQKKWDQIQENYNSTKVEKLGGITKELIESSAVIQRAGVYEEVYEFLLEDDGYIDSAEASILVNLLDSISNKDDLSKYIDELLLHSDERRYGEIAKEIVRLDPGQDCVGYNIAEAIYNIELYSHLGENRINIVNGFKVLEKYKDKEKFAPILVRLKNTLDHDTTISVLQDELDISRVEIKELFQEIDKMNMKRGD
ncbi:MAG: protein kinase [Agathobacter sp.]|nr:protein kinase [Agathobacter sp.]